MNFKGNQYGSESQLPKTLDLSRRILKQFFTGSRGDIRLYRETDRHTDRCTDRSTHWHTYIITQYLTCHILQRVLKVAVHLGVWVAIARRHIVGPLTSLPAPFVSAERLSERTVHYCDWTGKMVLHLHGIYLYYSVKQQVIMHRILLAQYRNVDITGRKPVITVINIWGNHVTKCPPQVQRGWCTSVTSGNNFVPSSL
jgi:hypothetical protein